MKRGEGGTSQSKGILGFFKLWFWLNTIEIIWAWLFIVLGAILIRFYHGWRLLVFEIGLSLNWSKCWQKIGILCSKLWFNVNEEFHVEKHEKIVKILIRRVNKVLTCSCMILEWLWGENHVGIAIKFQECRLGNTGQTRVLLHPMGVLPMWSRRAARR